MSPILVNIGDMTVRQKSDPQPLFKLKNGQRVVVSWYGKNQEKPHKFRGEYWVDQGSIEPVTLWYRQFRFKRIHPKQHDTLPFIAENLIFETLRSNGVRVDKATDFEDEKLGIDLWLFLKIGGGWNWFPVDITLRRDVDVHRGEKFDKGFKKGVITVRVEPLEIKNKSSFLYEDFLTSFRIGYDNFLICSNEVLPRSIAKSMEERF